MYIFYSEVISAAQDCAISYLYQLVFYLCIIQTKPQLQGRDPKIKMFIYNTEVVFDYYTKSCRIISNVWSCIESQL